MNMKNITPTFNLTFPKNIHKWKSMSLNATHYLNNLFFNVGVCATKFRLHNRIIMVMGICDV